VRRGGEVISLRGGEKEREGVWRKRGEVGMSRGESHPRESHDFMSFDVGQFHYVISLRPDS